MQQDAFSSHPREPFSPLYELLDQRYRFTSTCLEEGETYENASLSGLPYNSVFIVNTRKKKPNLVRRRQNLCGWRKWSQIPSRSADNRRKPACQMVFGMPGCSRSLSMGRGRRTLCGYANPTETIIVTGSEGAPTAGTERPPLYRD